MHLFLISALLVGYACSLDNGLGSLPPLGWNTWCTLGKCGLDYCNETEVYDIAQTMSMNGMLKLGYNYVNLDDCWADTRDASGNILPDPKRFPSGMKALAGKIHALGMLFGLYTCAGTFTCSAGGRDHQIPGSFGHYEQDANTFASWDIDFVKMDWCNTKGLDPQTQYTQFSKALNVTGRPIYFEMCEWGVNNPWEWATPVANQWRTHGDHLDAWANTLGVINAQVGLSKYSGAGHWNYMDFIYTGGQACSNDPSKHCPGQTDVEYRTEFSFWSLLNSALIVATDIRIMTPIMKEILFNDEIIAVNQDIHRKQGDLVNKTNNAQVWARPLANGSEAVILFNDGEATTSISAKFEYWGWAKGTKASIRDLWAHKDVGSFTDEYTVLVDPHAVVFIILTKQ